MPSPDEIAKFTDEKRAQFERIAEQLTGTSDQQKAFTDSQVIASKELRRDIDAQLQKLKVLPKSRERSISITKLQEAIMWLGMDLKQLNDEHPYPNSYDPSNTKVEPTADGLKL